nr:hypothetical protein [Cerasicoccus maritimus]
MDTTVCGGGTRVPKNNREYWLSKIARNVARDKQHLADYEVMGWQALVLWECELKDEAVLAERLRDFLLDD